MKNLCSERLTEKEYCIGRNTLSKQCVTTLNVKDIFVQPVVIPACAVGAPHRRDRVFFIAHRADAGVKVCNENGRQHSIRWDLLPTPRAVEVVEHP